MHNSYSSSCLYIHSHNKIHEILEHHLCWVVLIVCHGFLTFDSNIYTFATKKVLECATFCHWIANPQNPDNPEQIRIQEGMKGSFLLLLNVHLYIHTNLIRWTRVGNGIFRKDWKIIQLVFQCHHLLFCSLIHWYHWPITL